MCATRLEGYMMPHSQISYNRHVPQAFTILTKAVFFLGLFVLSYQSIVPVPGEPVVTHFDKVQHFIGYAVLAGLFALAWPRLRLVWVAVLPIIYGAGIEVVQSVTPYGRTGSIFDGIANTLGVIGIIVLWMLWVQFRAKRKV